jgi:hypothetical protein
LPRLTMEQVVVLVVLPVLGAIVHHLWTRYRSRLVTLRWAVQYQPMAFATHDFGWGQVEILYNKQPILNLHIAQVQVQNASARDLQNLQLDMQVTEGTRVLRSSAQVAGTLQDLPFASGYATALAAAAQASLPADQVAFWVRRSDFIVPVLNRGGIVEGRLLLARDDYATPSLVVACNHLGVRLKHQPLVQVLMGVRQPLAQVIGLLISVLLTLVVLYVGAPTWLTALVAWLGGTFATLWGALTVRAWQWLIRLAD